MQPTASRGSRRPTARIVDESTTLAARLCAHPESPRRQQRSGHCLQTSVESPPGTEAPVAAPSRPKPHRGCGCSPWLARVRRTSPHRLPGSRGTWLREGSMRSSAHTARVCHPGFYHVVSVSPRRCDPRTQTPDRRRWFRFRAARRPPVCIPVFASPAPDGPVSHNIVSTLRRPLPTPRAPSPLRDENPRALTSSLCRHPHCRVASPRL